MEVAVGGLAVGGLAVAEVAHSESEENWQNLALVWRQ